ncbi:hypothetical protein IW261DRAFT_1021178 [Armillaria novae-zelandiae]|uniref:Aminoglycoside phosphotransferase domain-containing protein n=1 Tax=Armillaria novae-zelandiae TaxID=153914 RepID=A0AA39NN33_9AGAR|nr:hypothetical protein IW261DRAFT_1021178 [Armillaria novae-zelandiae]
MVGTMRLITERTSLPLPIVHAYDSTRNNSLGYAYVLLSFIEPVVQYRTKPDALTDPSHCHIFEHVANSMAQLRVLEFDRIGELEFTGPDRSYTIGPLREIKDGEVVYEIGPFSTALSYINELASLLIDKYTESPPCYAHYSLLRLLGLFLPNRRFDGPPFVLSPPNFDSQNVMVDLVTFAVTRCLDWDDVSVGPGEGGYACYPAWIHSYDWPPRSSVEKVSDSSSREEPPEMLQAHRDLYHAIYSDIDPIGAEATRHSHFYEAIVIGLSEPVLSSEIMVKLTGHVFDSKWAIMGELLFGMEEGKWLASRWWCALR